MVKEWLTETFNSPFSGKPVLKGCRPDQCPTYPVAIAGLVGVLALAASPFVYRMEMGSHGANDGANSFTLEERPLSP